MNGLQGFLLHRRPYRETSYLADFFTLEQGKVSAVVKGVRNSKSDRKSLLQGFQPLQLSFSGRHELKNLVQIEASGKAYPLQATALYCAMYLNELLNRALQPDLSCESLYQGYRQALQGLSEGNKPEPTLREYELTLLHELGFALDLSQDFESGEAIVADAQYQFIPQQGVRAAHQLPAGIKVVSGQLLLDIHQGHWHKASLQAAKWLNRQALVELIGDKPLKSRELFIQR